MGKICFNGLTTVNVELTSRCNKNCWMCGRRKIDREYPELALNYGDMEFSLVEKIAQQLPEGIVVQLHSNGEPFLYPRLGDAIKLFDKQIKCLDTNGKLLLERADEVIGHLDTITLSVIESDKEEEEQYKILKEFLNIKGDRKPYTVIRCLGKVDLERYAELDVLVVTRILHSPMGSFHFQKNPTIPEIGICLDLLNHLSISRDGKVSICVRFDPRGEGVIGDLNTDSLFDIWNGQQRKEWIEFHKQGHREKVPLCKKCEFWGVPRGY